MVENIICVDTGQAQPDEQESLLEDPSPPMTDVDAYAFGWRAAREGVDARFMIRTAALKWPLHPFDDWCEAVVNATLGYWAAMAGGDE